MDSSLGFTLLEIIAVSDHPKNYLGSGCFQVTNTRAEDLPRQHPETHLRYAQLRAMGEIETGSYALIRKDDKGAWVKGCWETNDRQPCILPGENSFEKFFEKTSVTNGTEVVGLSAAQGTAHEFKWRPAVK